MAIEEQKAIIPEKTFEEVVFAAGDESTGFTTVELSEPAKTADDLGLNEEDITYLKLKWGKSYKPEE